MIKKIKKLKDKLNNNKPFKICYGIFKGICWIILLMILFVILLQKFTHNKLTIGGYRIFSVASLSMKDEYKIGDIIIDEAVDAEDIKVGDNVTYLGNSGDFAGIVVTHKVMSIREDNGTYYYITKGTANKIEDPEISYSQIYGRVVYKPVTLSLVGRIMTNIYAYYALYTVVGIIVSLQICKIVFEDKEEDDGKDGEEKETKNNS